MQPKSIILFFYGYILFFRRHQAKIVQKDLFELDSKDLIDFDIIIDAFGEWENLSLHKKHIEWLSKILQGSKVKLFVVGGAGSLYMDENYTTRLMDMPDFPKEYLDIAKANAEVLEFLRNEKGFKWVYVSTSAIFHQIFQKPIIIKS